MKLTIAPALALLLGACHPSAPEAKPDFLTANIDSTVKPSEDFFQFANGGWIKRTPIPASERAWGLGNLVEEEIYDRLKKVNEDAGNQTAPNGSTTQKIADFWYSGMDTADIDRQGLEPIKPQLEAIQNLTDITSAVAALHLAGVRSLFGDAVGQDDKNSAQMAYQLYQGGLGMPNRDYYFNTDARTVAVRTAYTAYLEETFTQLGSDNAQAAQKAGKVMALETRLAKASRKLADLRDPYRNYHKLSIAQLQQLTPAFHWSVYLEKTGIKNIDSVIVGQPEFFTELNKQLKETPAEDWKDYLTFHLIQSSAPYLDSATFGRYFTYTRSLSGVTEPKPRWKRVIDAEQEAIGEALGQLFVREYFNEKAKQRYSDLIENVRAAFRDRIQKLTWMSDTTKQRAYDKLAKITKKVGYPDKWKDFSTLTIDRGPYVLNMQRARAWWRHYNADKLGKPVDRTEWDMTPQTYNAYYNPSNNEIVMTAAGFTIPGMRDEELDDAFVYGYAGANWIGHEMTHGFDDQGRQYDAAGNLANWWLPQDSIQFAQRAQKIIRQFDAFNPVDTLHINGSATQGENIADLGGMLIGLDAFKKTETYKKGEKIAGYTPLQRFFLGYAYGWMAEMRKEALANQVMTDVHAPEKERTNGPVVNVPEFYEAFDVKPGDKMYQPDSLRVKIW
ncbi:MAG TPA: M13 family metallopeptidase [Dinghuibacter sp.]|jgi:putative endopeptidase|uniref:M13 family metallopeptidase n=1 Tax=Dinghuibacter sp. TaxID=2024697 RepID=UPI002BD48EC7|nr:M13 family metallopeptidase [Dinghuibacter sp.]HTJ14682.1 M13 family metallopeptidase [Dinghuibacter sp.]